MSSSVKFIKLVVIRGEEVWPSRLLILSNLSFILNKISLLSEAG
jgi:hypothetical protein